MNGELRLTLLEEGADTGRAVLIGHRLRELEDLDVKAVSWLSPRAAPGDTGPAGVEASGVLIITLGPSRRAMASVIAAVRTWLASQSSTASVRIDLGGDVLYLSQKFAPDQQRAIQEFLVRHSPEAGAVGTLVSARTGEGVPALPDWFDDVIAGDAHATTLVRAALPDALEAVLPELVDLAGAAWRDLEAPLVSSLLQGRAADTEIEPAYVFHMLDDVPAAQARLAEVIDAYIRDDYSRKRLAPEPSVAPPPREELAEAPASPPRHVNLWLARPATLGCVSGGTRIAAGAGYLLRLSIGPLAEESVVQGGPPFPEDVLPPSEDGYWLEVAVASFDFVVPSRLHPLYLPRTGPAWVCSCLPGGVHSCLPEARSPFLNIPVMAPAKPGSGHVRVAVYFVRNLVQSLLMTAEVGMAEEPAVTGAGISAVVDFTLSSGLTSVGTLPTRSLNILTNEDPTATHTLVINGEQNDVVAFRLTEGQMSDAIGNARATLRDIHIEEFGGGLGAQRQAKNRYDSRNAKTREKFEADLRRLARVGRSLWDVLLTDKPERRRQLRATLGESRVIQVGRTGGSSFVFPWSLIYDITLEPGNEAAWTSCPVLGEWDTGIDPSAGDVTDRCPRADAHTMNTICPFGFWGYRHQIETPPSVPRGRTLALTVPVDTPPPQAVVAVSKNLDPLLTNAHLHNLDTALADFDLRPTETRAALVTELQTPALEVLYFYCHGRRQDVPDAEAQPFLEVGNGEVLAPGDLGAWFEAMWPQDHWMRTSPLVFINGCHTVEITPRTLVKFVDAFAGVYAAGVIGTETPVHQQVAGEVAEEFWGKLRRGATVGRALQAARIRLLRKGNLMGLAYTAYCSVDLRLVGLAP